MDAGTAARPCRLRRSFISAPPSSRLRPHGRAAPSCRFGAPQRHGQHHEHRVPGHAPALAPESQVTATSLPLAPDAWPGPLHHPGAQRRDPLLAPVARAVHPPPATPTVSADQLGLREHVARHSLCEGGAAGSISPWHRDRPAHLARKCPQWHSRRSPCARAGAPCSRSISESGDARGSAPASCLVDPGPVFARLGRRSPRRSFPPGPPNLGTPLPLATLAK